MKSLFLFLAALVVLHASSQKQVYNVELFGKIIGTTIIEKTEDGKGEIRYKLTSSTEVNILFNHKTSTMVFDVIYKEGRLLSSYCKNVKDGVTEVTTVLWDGTKYIIKKGSETLNLNQVIDFSAIRLYFMEPKGKSVIFSERIGEFCKFLKIGEGEYECKLANGVNNIYRYKNGVLYELEMSKGASVFMRLVQ